MYLTRIAGVLACSALATAPLAAQGTFKDALPAKTLGFFTIPNLNSSIAEFDGTAFAKMWREEELQDFVKDAMRMGKGLYEQRLGELREMHKAGGFPVDPDDILKLRVQSISGAMTSMALEMGEFGSPEPRMGVLIHLGFGESAPTWRKLSSMGLEMLVAQSRGQAEKTTATLESGVELITIGSEMSPMSLNVAFVNDGIVIGTLTDEVKTFCNNLTGKKTVLTKDPNYLSTVKYLDPAGAEVEVYASVAGYVDLFFEILKLVEQEIPGWPEELQVSGLERAFAAFGARSVKSIGITSKYEGSKAVTKSFVLAPSADRKGFFAGKSSILNRDFLPWVPEDVASISASSVDMTSVYDTLVGAVQAYNPDMAKGLLEQLKGMEAQLGITLKDDLFGVFGKQTVIWSMGVQSFMAAPEGAMLLEVKNQASLLASLEKLANMSEGVVEFPMSERKGVKTWRMELNLADLGAAGEQISAALAVLQPCFSFKNGYMVLAWSTGDVRRALKRMNRTADSDPAGDVRSNKEFSAYMKRIEQQPVSSITWTDWKSSFESMYSAATSVLAFAVSADEVPFDLTLLPEAETLSQHLFSSFMYSTDNSDGYLTMGYSPMGPELMVGLAVLGGAGVATFAVRSTEARAPMARAMPMPIEEVEEVEAEVKDEAKAKKAEGTKKSAESKKTKEVKIEKARGK